MAGAVIDEGRVATEAHEGSYGDRQGRRRMRAMEDGRGERGRRHAVMEMHEEGGRERRKRTTGGERGTCVVWGFSPKPAWLAGLYTQDTSDVQDT